VYAHVYITKCVLTPAQLSLFFIFFYANNVDLRCRLSPPTFLHSSALFPPSRSGAVRSGEISGLPSLCLVRQFEWRTHIMYADHLCWLVLGGPWDGLAPPSLRVSSGQAAHQVDLHGRMRTHIKICVIVGDCLSCLFASVYLHAFLIGCLCVCVCVCVCLFSCHDHLPILHRICICTTAGTAENQPLDCW